MRKAVLMLLVAMMVGCGGGGKGGSEASLTGPTDLHAAMLPGDGGKESSGIATLAFSVSPAVRAGEEFTVDVVVGNASIFGAAYSVKFNDAHLQFVRIEEGSFLKKDGAQTILMKSLKDGNLLIVGQTRLGHVLNATGSGTIARITFKALNSRNTDIQFSKSSLKEQIVENEEYLLSTILSESQNATIRIE